MSMMSVVFDAGSPIRSFLDVRWSYLAISNNLLDGSSKTFLFIRQFNLATAAFGTRESTIRRVLPVLSVALSLLHKVLRKKDSAVVLG